MCIFLFTDNNMPMKLDIYAHQSSGQTHYMDPQANCLTSKLEEKSWGKWKGINSQIA